MSAESFMRPGAVDLSALAARRESPAEGAAGGNGAVASDLVIDATDGTFEEAVLKASATVPVVIDLWADWCGPCKQLSPILEKLTREYNGRLLLAKVDVDANPQVSTAFQVQAIPSVFAVVGGRVLPLFQGALPEPQVRQVFEQLLKAAASAGVTGRVDASGATITEEPELPHDPRYDAAFDAIEKGDLDAAATAYRSMLTESPGDVEAKAGLAQVDLLRRAGTVDARQVLTAAQRSPADVAAQLLAADVEMLSGQVDAAFARLVDTVRRMSGDDRETVRSRLLDLFEIVGPSDPRVAKARSALASALF
ncbi:MAG: tetratricopeptide repeat protein [Jiangellaceae bacterium]|nr:tetratricopeptide repeat protein [Jiangellaceae bacterium]